MGGLGNQLFILSFALYLQDKCKTLRVKLDTRALFWIDFRYKRKFECDFLLSTLPTTSN